MDDLDRLSASMMTKAESCPETSGSSGGLPPAKPLKSVSFAADRVGGSTSSTPPSETRVWIIGDYHAEMITALRAIGVAAENIRACDTRRSSVRPSAESDG